MFIDGGGGGLPSVSGDSYTVKIMPVTASDVSGYTAQEIMQLFEGLDPEAVAQAGAAHTAAAGKLADLANAVSTHVSRLQANWGGQAASSAVDAFSKLQTSAVQLATAAKQTGAVLTTLGTSVLPEYKSWTTTVPSGSTGTSKAAVAAAAQLQTQANVAAQQKLGELNDALVSANGALPATIKVSLPKLGSSAGTASLPAVSGGTGGGSVGSLPPVGSTGGGRHAAPTPPSPAPAPPTTQKPAPIQLSGNPAPGTPTGTGTGTGTGVGTGGGSGLGTGSGPGSSGGTGPGSLFPGSPGTSTSTSGTTGPSGTGTPPGQDNSVPPGDEVGVGGDVPGVPGSFFPGSGGGVGPVGTLPPGDQPVSQSGFGNGNGSGVGEGVVPPDDSFGTVPGDTAVIGPDGMIGVPGSPMGGFGAFAGEPVAGESGVSGFAGADAGGPFAGAGGGMADGNVAAGGVAGAEGADGVGGMGYGGMPMGGGVGGSNNEKDRYRQSWMNEDADLWNGGEPMVPSLIGR